MTTDQLYDPELETTPWADVQKMTFEAAREQLERVYDRSPFYRRRFDEAGVRPSDVRRPEDLARIPLMDKEQERQSQDEDPPFGGHLCADREDIVRIYASSGTTGRPTFFALTQRDLDAQTTIMARVFHTAGIRKTDAMGALGNLSMFVGGVPALDAATRLGCTSVPIGATAGTQRTLELLKETEVTTIAVTPSFAVYLGELVEQHLGIAPKDLGLRLIMVGGEPGGQIPAVRKQISEIWGCPVRDVMGIGEFAGTMWGESSDEDGMHWCAQREIHLELIDHETAEPIPWEDGAVGELVYTSVQRDANPLIRFRSHDHVLVRTGTTPSGRTSPRITTLGRTDDMLLVRGINVFPSAIRDVVAGFGPKTTGHIQVVLDKPGPLVTPPLTVEAECADGMAEADRAALAEQLVDAMRQQLSFKSDVKLVPAGSLPRSTMKTQYIRLESAENS